MDILQPKLKNIIKDLKMQEQMCIEKYERSAKLAKDPQLVDLFNKIKGEEEQHYRSLDKLENGVVEEVEEKQPEQFNARPVYVGDYNQEDKENDKFLCTDSICTEKYVSSAYNFNLFQFANEKVRKLLNHIQTEEQNHAEMIYKYKEVNGMLAA